MSKAVICVEPIDAQSVQPVAQFLSCATFAGWSRRSPSAC
jgi:hypothetical protein